MNLIGNGMLAPLRHPEQYAQLVGDPSLIPNAIEEFLRYDGPVQAVWRAAGVISCSASSRSAPGSGSSLAWGQPTAIHAVSRSRSAGYHRANAGGNITFGYGIHYCLGAPLARLEAQVAFATLLRRLPGLQLADETVAWRGLLSVRGVQALPLAFERARARG